MLFIPIRLHIVYFRFLLVLTGYPEMVQWQIEFSLPILIFKYRELFFYYTFHCEFHFLSFFDFFFFFFFVSTSSSSPELLSELLESLLLLLLSELLLLLLDSETFFFFPFSSLPSILRLRSSVLLSRDTYFRSPVHSYVKCPVCKHF